MTSRLTLPVFAAYGLELEYMIVDRESLAVRPIAERLLAAFAGAPASSVDRGMLGWSNELVSHVVELKNVEPTPALDALAQGFQREVNAANRILERERARLLPTGMHPWMDPRRETTLWQADGREIYRMYDRIFDCRRHGWANLQSMHINLPFADDAQFERLHAAVRIVLPLVPALAASSPIAEGRLASALDYRLEVYRTNVTKVPSMIGSVIPDTARTRAEYQRAVLEPMYAEILPHDPAGVMRHEWLNSRAAIPRFDRNAIEIRLADTQECPGADVAVAAAVIAAVHAVHDERWSPLAEQQALPTPALHAQLLRAIRDADDAVIDDPAILRAIGLPAERRCTARDAWRHLVDASSAGTREWWRPAIDAILTEGTLARRIVRTVGGDCAPERLRAVYGDLARCLAEGRMLL